MNYQDTFKRYEMKYLLSSWQKDALCAAMMPYMEPDEYGRSSIMNIYYDTPDHLLIRRSLEKPVYKEKLRLRSYGIASADTGVFIELKKKYKGIVYKRRISAGESEAMNYLNRGIPLQQDNQILREIEYFRSFYRELKPSMVISYEREAYRGIFQPELRMTFDENILWREEALSLRVGPYGTSILKRGQVLLEIKVSGAMPLWLAAKLSELGVFGTSFSKYGNAYLQKQMTDIYSQERIAL